MAKARLGAAKFLKIALAVLLALCLAAAAGCSPASPRGTPAAAPAGSPAAFPAHTAVQAQTPAPAPTPEPMPSHAPPALLGGIVINYYFDQIEYSMQSCKPAGYPDLVRPGLAREMEKHRQDAGRLYDAVIICVYGQDEFKTQFRFNGMTYDAALADYSRKTKELYQKHLDEINSKKWTDEEFAALTARQKLEDDALYNDSVVVVFDREYHEEYARRVGEALEALKKTHDIEVRQIWENLYYSEFTREELLRLAQSRFDCCLVGRRELKRPEGYPGNIPDQAAIILARAPAGGRLQLSFGLFCCKQPLSAKKRSRTEASLEQALAACGVPDKPVFSLITNSGETQAEQNEITVSGTVLATRDQALAFAQSLPGLKIYSAWEEQAYLDYHFDAMGDGCAAQ